MIILSHYLATNNAQFCAGQCKNDKAELLRHFLVIVSTSKETAAGHPAAVSFRDVLYIPEVYWVCNAGLYYIHVR